MAATHVLLQLVPLRVQAVLNRLEADIWRREVELDVEATEPRPEQMRWSDGKRQPLKNVRVGDAWGRLFDQRWYRLRFPALRSGKREVRYLEWRDEAEATLYVDGVPYYGFDVAHRRVALPPVTREVWVESICVQSAIWHPEATGLSSRGSIFGGAFLVRRNDEAWDAWHDLKCLYEVVLLGLPEGTKVEPGRQQPPLVRCAPVHRQLLRALSDLCDAADTSGAKAVTQKARRIFERFRKTDATFATAVLTGHAHIDLVWLWPERVGEAKAVHTFATVSRLLEMYPEFCFAYSQPASYAAVARRAPELFGRVKKHLRGGRWEATGAMYVESDTLLACGEALARSLVYGQEDLKTLRGEPSPLLWLPDVFGYAGCLPQLMRLAGVEYFFTTKLLWNAVNRFPFSSFVWRGTDGSEIVAHVTQDVGYNCTVSAAQLQTAAYGHQQSDVHPEFLHPTGYGDGGGGPTEEMCERARRLDALPGLPSIGWGQPEAFFERLAAHRASLPVCQGELYLEYHRGTYTTHARVKAAFRALERALQLREAVAVTHAENPDLGGVWRRLIFAQFHDYIPGSSVPEVYAEGIPELERLAREQTTAAHASLAKSRPQGSSCVFNSVPLSRRVVVDDRLLELAPLSGDVVENLLIIGARKVEAVARTLGNGRVQLRVDAAGGIVSLRIDGEPLALRPGTGQLVLFVDRASNFEAWDIDRHVLALREVVDTTATISTEMAANGLRGALSIRRKVGKTSFATIRYVLEAESDALQVEVELDWNEAETLLKFEIVSDYRGAQMRCGAPFGSVLRPQQLTSPAAEAMWEMPASRHIAVTDDGGRRGLAVVTENKYGFSVHDGAVGISLMRSPRQTGYDAGHRKAYPAALSRIKPTSIYTDHGPQVVRFALARYDANGLREQQPAARAETLFTPVIAYRGSAVTCRGWLGLEDGETLIPCWARPMSDGAWCLRLHEVGGERGIARLKLEAGWTAQKIDLLGEAIGAPLRGGELEFRPQEIVGVKLTPPKRGARKDVKLRA